MSKGAAIVSDKQLGDVLLLQPSAQHLAQANGCPTALFVREAFRPMVELMPGCLWGPEVKPDFEQVWITSWSSKAVWQGFRLRTKNRLLIANKPRHVRWWYRWLVHEVRMEAPSAKYWALYFWQIVSGQPIQAFTPPILLAPSEGWAHPQAPREKFLLINPTAAWSRKFWGARQWAEIIQILGVSYGLPVVIAGGGSEKEKAHCQAIAEACSHPVLNLAGQTSMQQYLHLLSRAHMVLCIDGAASHLAQAFSVPTVTIFGPTHDKKWHWATPLHRVLAARTFVEPEELKANPIQSADKVPGTAVLAEALALLEKVK